jgi:heterodisulfide reductase subunit C
MDHAPRQIVAWLRAGEIDRVLASNTVWFCASCYLCAVRCPAGIPFTDVMYALKRLSVEKGIAHKGARSLVLAREFARSVDRHGRVSESELLRNYFLRTNPFAALPQMPVAARLFFRGRLPVRPHGIEGLEGLRRMLAAVEENGK